jgi:CheY-like chemotaxis protein
MSESSKKIMIVEDDQFLIRALSDKLTSEGHNVILAGNGEEALEKISSESPSLIILDLIMPTMNGFEFLEAVHNDSKIPEIPIVVISNLGQDSDIEKAKGFGAKEFFIKSNLQLKEVVEVVNKYIK